MVEKNIIGYLKDNGFFSPNAEIYGKQASAWDLGSHGTELKKKLESLWWKYFVSSNPYNIGSESCIMTHSKVLAASGHLKNFNDWLIECKNCKKRYRLDNLVSEKEFKQFLLTKNKDIFIIKEKCPDCKRSQLSDPKIFNLLLSTNLEKIENKENKVYLRPETCQSIFINFLSIQKTAHKSLPFGVGQIGKSFRNEITLRHGPFRVREFTQAEMELFHSPEENEKWWAYWTDEAWKFLNKIIINDKKKIQRINLNQEELPHYAKKTQDLYFNYHFGWGEICSNSYRGNYDLTQHSSHSNRKLEIAKIIPEVTEVSFGIERLMLAVLEDAYQEETIKNSQSNSEKKSVRHVLKISPLLAPYFVAVIPLSKELKETAQQVYFKLLKSFSFDVTWEESSSIGKSYRRQDAIGTYYCLTVDFETIQKKSITCRQRDNMEQIRINISSLKDYLTEQYEKHWKEFI